ncbi:hypothetical protein H2198_007857 [Neophaeococcomyces mojaviensis]|uniref:Uncharacterized protein n=1 Tax=Neophaeococcomyces mojaviensis TaxID=3383035 RepID=A0ACC2ZZ15_9EURO|nr:hypothetical protein H2198_007857 [Knufia sp. JES_112]
MPTSQLFDFADASLKGDSKWVRASPKFGAYAPLVVIALAVLSIVEIVLGVVWITSIQSLRNGWGSLSFAQVIQPLIVPGLSFFNTIPSLHLHVLARSNNPLLAMVFSILLSIIFLASAVIFLPPCAAGNATYESTLHSGYQRTECPQGSKRGIWAAMIALQFISAIGYAVHAAMAWVVRRNKKRWDKGVREGTVMDVVDEETKRKREEEARRRWRELGMVGA